MYATFGAGLTLERETDIFQKAYYNNAQTHYNYTGPLTGIETRVPNNRTHFNAYCSPVGIKFGKKLGGYIEIGIGYKGMINGGISYRFGKGLIHRVHIPYQTDDIVLLPHNFPVDSNIAEIGRVGTGSKQFNKFSSFYQNCFKKMNG